MSNIELDNKELELDNKELELDNEDEYETESNYSYDSETKDLIYKSSLRETLTLTENTSKKSGKKKYEKINNKKNLNISHEIFIPKTIKRNFNPRLPPYLLINQNKLTTNIENNECNFPKL